MLLSWIGVELNSNPHLCHPTIQVPTLPFKSSREQENGDQGGATGIKGEPGDLGKVGLSQVCDSWQGKSRGGGVAHSSENLAKN